MEDYALYLENGFWVYKMRGTDTIGKTAPGDYRLEYLGDKITIYGKDNIFKLLLDKHIEVTSILKSSTAGDYYADIADFLSATEGLFTSVSGGTSDYFELPDAAIQVTVTTTAATLQSLLAVVDPTLTVAELSGVKYIEINAEGDIRYAVKSTPTTAKGMVLASGLTRILSPVNTVDLELIAASSTLVNVQLGY